MGLPVGLDGVALGALLALPLLLAVFPTEVLLNTSQVSESSGRMVMNTSLLRANVDSLPRFFAGPLL